MLSIPNFHVNSFLFWWKEWVGHLTNEKDQWVDDHWRFIHVTFQWKIVVSKYHWNHSPYFQVNIFRSEFNIHNRHTHVFGITWVIWVNKLYVTRKRLVWYPPTPLRFHIGVDESEVNVCTVWEGASLAWKSKIMSFLEIFRVLD